MENIEWTEKTVNPVSGCNVRHPWCYAWARALMLRGRYGYPQGDPFQPTFHRDKLFVPYQRKKPTRWFVNSMGEWMGEWISESWIKAELKMAKDNPHHQFLYLTHLPRRLKEFDYPQNAWIGVSINRPVDEVTQITSSEALHHLRLTDARIKFVSAEPLLEELNLNLEGIDWIIIGAKTDHGRDRKKFQPPEEWVEKLITEARRCGTAVFLKPNLNWSGEQLTEHPRTKVKP